ncbi:MAG: MBOAT family protein [Lachnospiraceae bacterium]|nr:MBOAT family protein [Lachnospiraceae bacterium]
MTFVSNIFLFAFLPIALGTYYIVPDMAKEYMLLFCSLVFYSFGSFEYLSFFIVVCVLEVGLGRSLMRVEKPKVREYLFWCAVIGNIAILFHFKYISTILNAVFRLSGNSVVLGETLAPMGISFFVFKAISYLADVYTGKTKPTGSPVHDLLYLSVFTQIQMGPISRIDDWKRPGKEGRLYSFDVALFSEGIWRFLIGFCKKILLADMFARIANEVFATETAAISAGYAWLGSVCFSLQLFFDFAGYSDMAIGLCGMFGYRCKENFLYPYTTDSFGGFWKRWHVSLGEWFRDYVYIPLGGSRNEKKSRTYANLLVVWILTGIWHGAGTTFLVWGLGWFLLIAMERHFGLDKRWKRKAGKVLYRIAILFVINLLWIFFRAPSVTYAAGFTGRLFAFSGELLSGRRVWILLKTYWGFLVAGVLLCTPIVPYLEEKAKKNGKEHMCFAVVSTVLLLACFVWALSFVITAGYNPFAYMKF